MTHDVSLLPPALRDLVRVDEACGCWEWLGTTNDRGYGIASVDRRNIGAHRLIYWLFVGTITKGLTLDHLCVNPSCVNPEHLEPVTMRENTYRGRGPTTLNAMRVRCKRDHLLAGDNVHITPKGYRRCRECSRMHAREWQRQRRARAAA